MLRRPPSSTRTDTPFPYTSLFRSLHRADKPNEELYSTTSRSTPDGLNSLPRDYTGPLLGPPLPGDLGRPILNAQNSGQPVPNPSIASPSPGISQEEQRRLQALERSEERRVGKECVSTGRSRGSPSH